MTEEVQGEFMATVHMLHIFLSTGGVEKLKRQGDAQGGDEDVRRWMQKRLGGAEVSMNVLRGGGVIMRGRGSRREVDNAVFSSKSSKPDCKKIGCACS